MGEALYEQCFVSYPRRYVANVIFKMQKDKFEIARKMARRRTVKGSTCGVHVLLKPQYKVMIIDANFK